MSQQEKQQRPRVYEPLVTPWRFEDLPPRHEARKTALFVVHGKGRHAYLDTALGLRLGLEDALYEICTASRRKTVRAEGSEEPAEDVQEMLPSPYIWEGYWSNYDSFEENFGEVWDVLTEDDRVFYSRLWKRRSMGTFRTAWWLLGQNLRLVSPQTFREFGFATGMGVIGMAPLTLSALLVMSVTRPKVLAEMMRDVRIYCSPKGSVEQAIVQRIDRRVGEQFLKLLGLDWDFKNLPKERLLNISGETQVFDYVTWIAHSLGTIVSYNVISDILYRIEERSRYLETRRNRGRETEEDRQLHRNIERVRKGLHRFYTFGSPLQNLNRLFPDMLRHWSPGIKQVLLGDRQTQNFWVNFYHAWDPVSERLGKKIFPLAISRHSRKLWRIPVMCHDDYWRDRDILKYIISRAYGPDLCKWEDPQFLGERTYKWARRALLTLMVILSLVIVALAVWWIGFGGGSVWLLSRAGSWVQNLFKKI